MITKSVISFSAINNTEGTVFSFSTILMSTERKWLNLHRDVNLKQGSYSRHKFGKTERPFPRPGKFVENVFCGARCWKVGEFHDHGQQRLCRRGINI